MAHSQTAFPELLENLQVLCRGGFPRGFRCDQQSSNIYALFGLAGRFWYHLLHTFLGFPGITTMKASVVEAKAGRGINGTILDDTEESIRLQMEFQRFGADRRCVVSIDAPVLKANYL